jgi:tetratricopeptide (TPR) repeat protein
MDYLVYAHLQLAQDKEARQVIDEMLEVKGFNPNVRTGLYAQAASLARYMVERKDWNGAARLVAGSTRFAYVDAITHFARALGASRSGNVEAARADIAKLAELRDNLRESRDAYWAEQVDTQWQVAIAWLLYAEGKQDEALNMMRAAADAEDKTEKSIVTPGPLAPARELYGAMLLERGMAKEALAAFEATLAKEPNRLGAYAGAARAAEQSGHLARAGDYYGKVVELSADADTSRKDVADARDFIAKRR